MTFIGYTPFEHQRAVHTLMKDAYRSGNVYAVKAKRQVGKTTMAENILLEFAINHKRTLNVLVEPTLDQSRRVYKEIVKAIEHTPIILRKNDSLLEIELATGSTILFKSAEQRDNLRGFTVTGILVVDECAFIQDDVYDILQPTCDVHSAPILLISTPKLKQGFYYRYYSAGVEGASHIISVDFNQYDTTFLLSQEKLEQYRKMMPRAQFTTEYLGEFLDSDSVLFTNLNGCLGSPREDWNNLYIGIDWGSGGNGDYTSICGFNEYREMVFIDYFNDKSTFEQAVYIRDIIRSYGSKVKGILAESNSIGTPMIALLKESLQKAGEEHLARLVNPFITTNGEKVRLVNQLQVALENKDLTLLDNKGLLTQLSAYEATYNPKTNNVSYNAPQGLHDDNCISTMLALDSVMSCTKKARYCVR